MNYVSVCSGIEAFSKAVNMETKVCADCKDRKPVDDFHRQPRGRHGRHAYCKKCYGLRYANRARHDPPERRRNRNFMNRYGLTTAQVEQMIADQNDKCLICEQTLKSPRVDHCHVTNMVRGILCNCCNLALGLFEHEGFYTKATQYLARFR